MTLSTLKFVHTHEMHFLGKKEGKPLRDLSYFRT